MSNILKELKSSTTKQNRTRILLGCAVLIALVVLEIYGTYLIPAWRKDFYSVLEAKDASRLVGTLQYFTYVMAALIFSQSLKSYVARRTALILRTSLTGVLLFKWKKAPHRMSVDNPSQRINEDCKIATDMATKVGVEVLISACLVVMLIAESSHNMLLVGSAVGYTVLVSLLAILFRKPLINTEINTQKAEADHRQVLSGIALGIDSEEAPSRYEEILITTKKYLRTLLGYTVFSSVQGQFSILVPWAVLSIPYFQGHMSLGDFMSGVAIFELIVVNSTILISLFPEVTKAQASWIRIREFYSVL
jgi:ABC-type uncharacterized transport system fused permease/ATPase subunit